MAKNIESDDISIINTGDDMLIVLSSVKFSKSHTHTHLSVEPGRVTRVCELVDVVKATLWRGGRLTRHKYVCDSGILKLGNGATMMVDFIHHFAIR